MSELRHLLEYRKGAFPREMFSSAAVCSAYKALLDGDSRAAETRFRRILQENSKDNEALAGLAICIAEDGGKFLTAEKMARQAVRLNKKSAAGFIALGYINLLGARLDDGYKYLMKAKHLAPRDPRLQAGLAIYDRERPPVIADLSRIHPVNQVLGGVRTHLRSPVTRVAALSALITGLYLAGSVLV